MRNKYLPTPKPYIISCELQLVKGLLSINSLAAGFTHVRRKSTALFQPIYLPWYHAIPAMAINLEFFVLQWCWWSGQKLCTWQLLYVRCHGPPGIGWAADESVLHKHHHHGKRLAELQGIAADSFVLYFPTFGAGRHQWKAACKANDRSAHLMSKVS